MSEPQLQSDGAPLRADPGGGPRRRLEALRTENEQLREALLSNRLIGEALGLVMARFRMTHDQAWNLLRQISQSNNAKLSEVAADLVDTHHAEL